MRIQRSGRSAAVPGMTAAGRPPGQLRLRGIGPNDAPVPGSGLSCRDLRSRRGPAGLAGPAPVFFAGGSIDRDRGISKAGSPMPRRRLARMAWRWLFHQPGSALSKWYKDYVSASDGRSRKRGTVEPARRPMALT